MIEPMGWKFSVRGDRCQESTNCGRSTACIGSTNSCDVSAWRRATMAHADGSRLSRRHAQGRSHQTGRALRVVYPLPPPGAHAIFVHRDDTVAITSRVVRIVKHVLRDD